MSISDADYESAVVKLEGETHVFWPYDDPLADNLISLRELMEFAERNGAAFSQFLQMRRLH